MSIKVMSWVWEHSQSKGGTLLVLLAIADFADDNGKAWPSVETLAKKSRMGDRNVRYAIRRLRKLGELKVSKPGKYRSNTYTVTMGANFAPLQTLQGTILQGNPATGCRVTLQPVAPKPSLTINDTPATESKNTAERLSTTREIQTAYEKACGYPVDWKAGAGRAAKWLSENGYAAAAVAGCYAAMKGEEFWKDKQVSLESVKKRIGEYLKQNGHNAKIERTEDGGFYL